MLPSGKALALNKIGFGGGCHWCTEGIFSSLKGVERVQQGWISPLEQLDGWSEGIIVYYDPETLSLNDLIAIHLHTHSSTSNHTMRKKYHSAIYTFNNDQFKQSKNTITNLQSDFKERVITQVTPFGSFKENSEEFLNYFQNNQNKPFCTRYILPKIIFVNRKFEDKIDLTKIKSPITL